MSNGKPGDHPLTDILHWKIKTFSSEIDSLIRDVVRFGGQKELDQKFDLLKPPPFTEFRKALVEMRGRLFREAKKNGWEVDEGTTDES